MITMEYYCAVRTNEQNALRKKNLKDLDELTQSEMSHVQSYSNIIR